MLEPRSLSRTRGQSDAGQDPLIGPSRNAKGQPEFTVRIPFVTVFNMIEIVVWRSRVHCSLVRPLDRLFVMLHQSILRSTNGLDQHVSHLVLSIA
jgi:hypothetical protein